MSLESAQESHELIKTRNKLFSSNREAQRDGLLEIILIRHSLMRLLKEIGLDEDNPDFHGMVYNLCTYGDTRVGVKVLSSCATIFPNLLAPINENSREQASGRVINFMRDSLDEPLEVASAGLCREKIGAVLGETGLRVHEILNALKTPLEEIKQKSELAFDLIRMRGVLEDIYTTMSREGYFPHPRDRINIYNCFQELEYDHEIGEMVTEIMHNGISQRAQSMAEKLEKCSKMLLLFFTPRTSIAPFRVLNHESGK